jgi:hypothetical protein
MNEALAKTLTEKILRLLKVTDDRGREHKMESRKLFLYWALRNAGESELQSVLEISRLDAPRERRPSREEFLILNGLYSSSNRGGSVPSEVADPYRLSETIVQAQTGIKEQMNLVESVNRKALKVEASSLQNRLIVLTFVLFIVPFAFLLSVSFISPGGSPVSAAFLGLHPLISYLVANWATMHDDLLAI